MPKNDSITKAALEQQAGDMFSRALACLNSAFRADRLLSTR